ncbi:MAG: mannitol dehydrogenase family protein [Pseudomonadota bacterium]
MLDRTPYNPAQCRFGVVHVGVGSFHRAHQAVYFHNLLHHSDQQQWGIAGVNLLPGDTKIINALRANNHRYMLETLSQHGKSTLQEIHSHLAFHDWQESRREILTLFANPDVKIVTITISESGYYGDDSGALQTRHPDISGMSPATIYEFLRLCLQHRKQKNNTPITIICCDNMQRNGHNLRRWFMQYLELVNAADLQKWVERYVTFPNTMVDRITPTPPALLDETIAQRIGRESRCAIMSEDFTQWVIEDNFATDPPALSRVGVNFVDDIMPFEQAKIRILNGGHSMLAYLGALRGHDTVDHALRDKSLAAMFEIFLYQEVLQGLRNDSPVDHKNYCAIIRARFANPHIADTLQRICLDGMTKLQQFILPTIEDCLARAILPEIAITTLAAWYLYLQQGPSDYWDPKWHELLHKPNTAQEFANCKDLWGDIPERHPEFVKHLVRRIDELHHHYHC